MEMKGKQRIPMLTAYTFPVAASIESAGIPIILVGDTVGMVEMGFSSTRDVTIEHMEYHVGQCVEVLQILTLLVTSHT